MVGTSGQASSRWPVSTWMVAWPMAKCSVRARREPRQRRVAGMALRHDQMRGERGFGRAHRPDVQVVHRRDAGDGGEMVAHRCGSMPCGTACSAMSSARRSRRQVPATMTAATARLTAGSSHSQPVDQHQRARAPRRPGSRRRRPAHGTWALLTLRSWCCPAPRQDQRGEAVDRDADQGDGDDGHAGDWLRRRQALHRLDGDRADGDQQDDGIEQRREDRRAAQAIGEARRSAGAAPARVGAPGGGRGPCTSPKLCPASASSAIEWPRRPKTVSTSDEGEIEQQREQRRRAAGPHDMAACAWR